MEQLESLFGVFFGIFHKSSTIVLGATIFVVTKIENLSVFYESAYFYYVILLDILCLFILSYLGELVKSTTKDYVYHAYFSDWIDAGIKYKKSMILFMENLQSPITLGCWFYDSLDLEIFQQVSRKWEILMQIIKKKSFF